MTTPRTPYPETTVGDVVRTVMAVVAILAAFELGVWLGRADARLDAPIECGDPLHENGVHRGPA